MEEFIQVKSILGLENLNNEITDIMAIIFSNSILAEKVEDGYYLARQKFSVT